MATWSGDGLSQLDFMKKDECILLDDDDNVTGHANKYDTHVFDTARPRGTCHRAFSVFLFDEEGKLLLQQRAQSKITFPSVWTNTCCSHPLFGYSPTEVDEPSDVASGQTPGVKRAAVRKLLHELGIEPSQVPESKFKFLTRLHYWAADTVTHGPSAEWGEHEIDYILFIQAKVDLKPNPEEVDGVKYVTQAELLDLMDPVKHPDLLWSPWFKLIANELLVGKGWWTDLEATLTTDKHVDTKTIFTFGPPYPGEGFAHKGCYGASRVGEAPVAKQGAYGKLKTHSESKVSQLCRVDEVFAALAYKLASPLKGAVDPGRLGPGLAAEVAYCDAMLGKVSRSFAAVIRQLPPDLVLDCMVFYLVLRALDTVEDDMTAFATTEEKLYYLEEFYTNALHNDKWKMVGVGEADEADLLENFFMVSKVFQALPLGSREVIDDINKRMGAGMARFVAKDLGQGTESREEYNLYCHYVAGLVGEGLSRLFVATGFEQPLVASDLQTSNSMGLFLQKTNIIRDYLEDFVDGRAWWPQDVWRKHATASGNLGEFAKPEAKAQALRCLNEMVTDALDLIPACLVYLRRLEDPFVFRFCAIPQIMAIATLDKCFNNHDVFTGVVKVRKGLAVKLIVDSGSIDGVEQWFRNFAVSIKGKVDLRDPCAHDTLKACDVVLSLTADRRPLLMRLPAFAPPLATFALAAATFLRDKTALPLAKQVAALLAGGLGRKEAGALVTTLTSGTFLIGYALSAMTYSPAAGTTGRKLKDV